MILGYFYRPVPPDISEYFDVIKEPICLREIHLKVSSKNENDTISLEEFVRLIKLCFRFVGHHTYVFMLALYIHILI